jgi:hypothetical protein
MSDKPRRLREPIQVYLDGRDRSLLDRLAKEADVPRAEILRMGLRRLATDVAGDPRGVGFRALMGVFEGADVPPDLAARHDEYLYPAKTRAKAKGRKKATD